MTLNDAIARLRTALDAARQTNALTYAQRLAIFQQIDALQEQFEIFLCEAPDYPDQDDEPVIIP